MKQLILIGLALGIGSIAQANVFKSGMEIFKSTKTYPNDTLIGFELVNKSNDTLYVVIREGSEIALGPGTGQGPTYVAEIKPGYTEQQEVKLGQDISIAIWKNKNPGSEPVTAGIPSPTGFGYSSTAELPGEVYTFPKNKTIYLTYDNKGLRPETGPLGGVLNKTDSGLSLANNVKQKDITPIKPSR